MKRLIGTLTEDVVLRAVVLVAGMSLYLMVLVLALTLARAID
jgi:hypothetical protein